MKYNIEKYDNIDNKIVNNQQGKIVLFLYPIPKSLNTPFFL